jgi:hypothetical protein
MAMIGQEVVMRVTRQFAPLAVALLVLAGVASAQTAISAKAGMIHVADGDVFLDDQLVRPKLTEFPDVKVGQVLRTGEGRAEVLLTPGSFLRLGEHSSFRMDSNRLTDVRLEALTGALLLEVMELLEDNSVTIQLKEAGVTIRKAGAYRFDAERPSVRVLEGELAVNVGGHIEVLREGRSYAASDGGWRRERFDTKETDVLTRWAKRRSSYVAMANISAARQAATGGFGFNQFNQSGWLFNPFFGTFTFLPFHGTMRSPFGFFFFSPVTVFDVLVPQRQNNAVWAGGGAGGGYGNAPVFATGGLPTRSVGSGYGGAGYGGGSGYGGGAGSGGGYAGGGGGYSGGGGARGGEGAGARGGYGGGGRGQ